MKTMIAIAIAAALSSGAAFARPDDVAIARVSIADLNLASSAGIQTLAKRVAVASRLVCGSPSNSNSLAANRAIEACRDSAIRGAMQPYDAQQIASN